MTAEPSPAILVCTRRRDEMLILELVLTLFAKPAPRKPRDPWSGR